MKTYKIYKNKKEIITWLDKHQVRDYTLIEDAIYGYVVDVNGSVVLDGIKLKIIPVKFNHVKGDFICSYNELTSLNFSPFTIDGSFYFNNNKIRSLKYCTQNIGKNFVCNNNQLISLKFSPRSCKAFYCSHNKLESLEFLPQKVDGFFLCNDNPKLGALQKIKDFKVIYQEHLIYKAKKDLFQNLEDKLDSKAVKKKIKL